MALAGREDALRAVASLLERGGGALVVRGERGSGRTAVLEHAHARAVALGYAVLRELPDDVPGDGLQAGVAVLERLTRAAPLAVLIDDADQPDLLAFIGRRLAGTRVVLLATAADGLPVCDLPPLEPDTARALLPSGLPERLAAAVVETADGLPLALVELGAAASAAADALLARAEIRVPVSARLADVLRARLDGLDAGCRAVLLAAAVDPDATLDEILTVAGATPADLSAALDAGALRLEDSRVRCTPLTALAATTAAGPRAVAAVHERFAEHLDAPDRRALHRAASRVGRDDAHPTGPGGTTSSRGAPATVSRTARRPDAARSAGTTSPRGAAGGASPDDPELAAVLDAAARERWRSGQLVAAVVAYQAAARVGADPVGRLLSAALVGLELGYAEVVRRLLDEAEGAAPPAELRPVIEWQRRALAGAWPPADEDDTVRLVDALVAGSHADAAVAAVLPLAEACWRGEASPRVRASLQAAADQLASDCIAALVDPHAATPPARVPTDAVDALHLAIAAQATGAWHDALRLVGPAVAHLQGQPLARARALQADAAFYTGDSTREHVASRAGWEILDEVEDLVADNQREAAAARLAAFEPWAVGDLAAAAIVASRAVIADDPASFATALATTADGRGAAGGPDGRDERATGARPGDASGPDGRDEPATGARPGDASGPDGRDEPATGARPGDASGPDGRDEPAPGARAGADLSAWPYVRARTLLAYGGCLRRAKRAAEAADVLRAARDELAMLGATAFVERAQRELRAAGEPAPAGNLAALTAHELRIARLAADGLSNPEIARRLDVSPRTIGSHLYRIFPKLGITSRAQLATALEQA